MCIRDRGECYHCHTGRCPVGVATQDPKLRARLNPDDAALRVYNYLHSMTLEAQLLARACGKTNIHSLEPEDLAALTSEASALANADASDVKAAKSSGSKEWILVLPQALANS